MSLSDADLIAWLKSPAAVPVMLVEAVASVGGVETTRYLSNRGYVTGPDDTPANTVYLSRVNGGARITEQLSVDGAGATMAFGDIEFDNTEGDLDAWLDDIWSNRSVKVWVGDMRWPRADFVLKFDGLAYQLSSRSRDVINLKVVDKLQRLNTVVSDVKLGGSTSNADRLIPIVLGEVHNMEPLLADPATLKLQANNGATERFIEVRDFGVPVATTDTLAAGTFELDARPAGQITVSVQGAKLGGVYVNTVAKLVELLATQYGTDPFDAGDLDAAQLAAFDTANPQPVGKPLVDRENVLGVCQELAASVGAQVVMTATGLLRLIKIDLTPVGTPTPVSAKDMGERSLQVSARLPVRAAVKLGYCRNWTVQQNLHTSVPAVHQALFAQEWLTSTASDAGVAAAYKLPQEPVQIDTLLLRKTDADAESARILALWSVQRTVFGYDAEPHLLLEELGGWQTITHERFGLAGGVTGQIVSITRDWLNCTASIEVLT